MSLALSALIDNTQAALGDAAGTYFTDAIVTAAIRAALSEINERAPVHAGDILDVVANQKVYEVSDIDERATDLLDVLKDDADGEDDQPLKFDTYWEDARLWFRLRTAETSGQLIVRYTIPHTINGLDSETTSTLPAAHDQYLVFGAAYHACIIRATTRVEANNLDAAFRTNYQSIAEKHRAEFDKALNKMSQQKAPVGEPRTDAWNDEWHGK